MREHCKGVGLLELLVTVVVLVVLLNLAIPNFWSFIQSNRVTAETNSLVTALNLARSEAVKRGEIVSICASNGAAPVPGCGADWANGWVVYVNPDGAGSPDGTNIVRVWEQLPSSLLLEMEVQGAASQNRLDYDDLGAVEVANLGNFRYQWHLQPEGCGSGRPWRRTVDVSGVGRVQVVNAEC